MFLTMGNFVSFSSLLVLIKIWTLTFAKLIPSAGKFVTNIHQIVGFTINVDLQLNRESFLVIFLA